MELELHQLERRYEPLRSRSAMRERRLLASIAGIGQQVPIVVVRDGERFVVVDGYKRVRAILKWPFYGSWYSGVQAGDMRELPRSLPAFQLPAFQNALLYVRRKVRVPG